MTSADLLEKYRQWRKDGSLDRLFPEVAALKGVAQPQQYHQEGDAYVHTLRAVEAVSPQADPRVFWGVLLHDIGKAATTRLIDGRIRSFGHAEVGADLVPGVMTRIGLPELSDDVAWLVRHHTFHFSWNITPHRELTSRQKNFTRHPLFPYLIEVCLADAAGSIGGEDKLKAILLIQDKA